MGVLKEIYTEKGLFIALKGFHPLAIRVCPTTCKKIKEELYPKSTLDLSIVPIRIVDGMKVLVDVSGFSGFEIIEGLKLKEEVEL